MSDKEQISALCERMCQAMIAKDEAVLDTVLADDFILVHLTGLRQSKKTVYNSHYGQHTPLLFCRDRGYTYLC